MIQCTACGQQNPADMHFCSHCGAVLSGESPEVEAGQIAYLLQQVADWRTKNSVPEFYCEWITRVYIDRYRSLSGSLAHQDTTDNSQPTSSPDTVTVSSSQPKPTSAHVAALLQDSYLSDNVAIPPVIRSQAPSEKPTLQTLRPKSPSRPWLAEFLEVHWMKLIALLGIVLVLVGMRQIISWQGVSDIIYKLLPILPVGLAVIFWRMSTRLRENNIIGLFALGSASIGMAGYSIIAINTRWMNTLIPHNACLIFASGVVIAGGLAALRQSRHNQYLHVVFAGIVALATSVLNLFLPLPLHASLSFTIYGGAYLLGMAIFLVIQKRWNEVDMEDGYSSAAGFWANVCALLIAGFSASGPIMGMAFAPAAPYILITVSLMYAGSALWEDGKERSMAACLFMTAAFLVSLVMHHRMDLYPLGLSAAILLTFSLLLDRVICKPQINRVYLTASVSYALFLGVMLLIRLAKAFTGVQSLTGSDMYSGVALGGLAAGLYAYMAFWRKWSSMMYSSALMACFSITLLTYHLIPTRITWLSPHLLAHDLLPFAIISLGIGGCLISRWREYSLPVLRLSLVAVAVSILSVGFDGFAIPIPKGVWSAMVAYATIASMGAFQVRQIHDSVLERLWLIIGLVGITFVAMLVGEDGLGMWGGGQAASAGVGFIFVSLLWLICSVMLYRQNALDLWVGPLRGATLITALLGTGYVYEALKTKPLEVTLLMILALFITLSMRALERSSVSGYSALFILLIAGLTMPNAFFAGNVVVAAMSLAGATMLLYISLLQKEEPCAREGVFALVLTAIFAKADPHTTPDPANTAGWLTASGLLTGSVFVMFLARNFDRPWLAGSSAVLFSIAWYELVHMIYSIPDVWLALTILPCAILVYGMTAHLFQDKENLRNAARQIVYGLAYIYIAWSVYLGITQPSSVNIETVTILLYGATLLIPAIIHPTHKNAGISVGILLLAYSLRIITLDQSMSCRTLIFSLAPLLLVPASRLIQVRSSVFGNTFSSAASITAAIAAIAAILCVSEPGQGLYIILALAISGSTFFGLFLLKDELAYAHFGISCFIIAYSLYIYQMNGVNVGVMDYYMIPIGLYLILLGHLFDRRKRAQNASMLWMMGLLMVQTPTFIATVSRHGPIHTALLIIECLGAVLWGIAQRLKMPVFIGAGFALAFALSLSLGGVMDIWSGIFALVAGIAMLSIIYYISLHQQIIRDWANRMGQGWR